MGWHIGMLVVKVTNPQSQVFARAPTRYAKNLTCYLSVGYRSMVAHANRLKEWHTPEAFVMGVVVADEESESLDTPGRAALS